MRTTAGLRRVDVIYRRVDDDFLDPLCFRPDSVLGVPGLMNAYRSGQRGAGQRRRHRRRRRQGDLPLRAGHDQVLPGPGPDPAERADLHLRRGADDRKYVLENLAQAGGEGTNESGGYGMLMGHQATEAEREEFAEKIKADPRNFIAQPVDRAEPAPEPDATARFEGRRVDLRPYILYGEKPIVMPGGLTRVALRKGASW